MTNSYRNYSTNLEKREIRTKHEERRAYAELKRKVEERQHWLEEVKLRDSENMGE